MFPTSSGFEIDATHTGCTATMCVHLAQIEANPWDKSGGSYKARKIFLFRDMFVFVRGNGGGGGGGEVCVCVVGCAVCGMLCCVLCGVVCGGVWVGAVCLVLVCHLSQICV